MKRDTDSAAIEWGHIAHVLKNRVTDVETTRLLANAANAGLSRILAIEGLKEGLHTREVYEANRIQQQRVWGAKWPSADDILGKQSKLKGTARMQRRIK